MRATLVAIAVAVFVAALGAVALAHPSEEGERYESVEWRVHPEEGRPAGRKIRVAAYYMGGFACQYRFHRVSARETTKSVTLKFLVHKREMKPEQACTLEVGGDFATAKLKKPLGDRELRHAPVTDP